MNFDYFSLIGDWISAVERMNAQLICNVTFPPQANKYQVSVTSRSLSVTPHPANLCGLGRSNIWTVPIAGQVSWTALDLDHPVLHWLEKMRKHYKVMNTVDIDNAPGKGSDNLMEEPQYEQSVHSEFVVEESDISEEKDNGEVKPPQVSDDFTPHQLKAKRRRGSLPHCFKMDYSKSLILHPHDDRSELQKLQSVVRKLH